LVPSGTLLHDNCGETFAPTQFGLFGMLAVLLATFFGMILPSANVVDLSVKSSAASAAAVAKPSASVIMLAARILSVIMVFL
jgi:hypothetical protein